MKAKKTLKELQKELDVFGNMKGSDINESIVKQVRNLEATIKKRLKNEK